MQPLPYLHFRAQWFSMIVKEGTDFESVPKAALSFARTGSKGIKIYGRIIGTKYGCECVLESRLLETIN